MPTSTDLVTDLPADFEVFGQAVDTSLADLKGGTTGQILSKATNADMDFTWVAPVTGDITAVTAGTGISGGGTSGDVTITNSMATTITTNGDLIYGTGSGTFTRRGIGSTGDVLTVSGGVPTWSAPSAAFVGAGAFNSATYVVANSTVVTLTFNSEKYDTNGFHDTGTNTSRFTIPAGKAGYYNCSLLFAFEPSSTGFRRVEIWKNGSVMYKTDGNGNNNGSTDTKPISAVLSLAVSDYIEFKVVQNSGSNLTAYVTDQNCLASITYLGA